MSMKKNLLDPHNDDFGAVLNCAVRYALGRQSYMPGLIIDYITPLLPEINDRTLYVLGQDITERKYCGGYGDPYIDEPDWMRSWKRYTRSRNGAAWSRIGTGGKTMEIDEAIFLIKSLEDCVVPMLYKKTAELLKQALELAQDALREKKEAKPIIHCNECLSWKKYPDYEKAGECGRGAGPMMAYDYCSCAERTTNLTENTSHE